LTFFFFSGMGLGESGLFHSLVGAIQKWLPVLGAIQKWLPVLGAIQKWLPYKGLGQARGHCPYRKFLQNPSHVTALMGDWENFLVPSSFFLLPSSFFLLKGYLDGIN
jgi:hypothetical protein